jgi:hypothetical protein
VNVPQQYTEDFLKAGPWKAYADTAAIVSDFHKAGVVL